MLTLDFSADLFSAQEHRVQRWALVCGPLGIALAYSTQTGHKGVHLQGILPLSRHRFQGMAFQRQKLWVPLPDKILGISNRNIAFKLGDVGTQNIKAGRNMLKQNDTQNLVM